MGAMMKVSIVYVTKVVDNVLMASAIRMASVASNELTAQHTEYVIDDLFTKLKPVSHDEYRRLFVSGEIDTDLNVPKTEKELIKLELDHIRELMSTVFRKTFEA